MHVSMEDTSAPGGKPKPKLHPLVAKLLWPLVIVGAIGFGWFAYAEWRYEKNRIQTNNASVKSLIVKIFAPEQGYVKKIDAQENDRVKKGQQLLELDNDYYKWEVDRALANYNLIQAKIGTDDEPGLSTARLQSSEANLNVTNAQLAQARADLATAQDLVAELEKSKNRPGFVQSQLTKAQNEVTDKQAEVTTLERQADLAGKELAQQQAGQKLVGFDLNQAKAELEQARLRFQNTIITSPIDGFVAQKNVSPGVLLQSGQYLMSVISLTDIWINANVKESHIERVKTGYPVVITLDAFSNDRFFGEVESISPAAGSEFALIPRDNASGNFIKTEALIPVRISILEDEAKTRMLPGMNATVTILTDPLNEHDKVVMEYRKVKARLEKQRAKNKAIDSSGTDKATAPTKSTQQPATEKKEASEKTGAKAPAAQKASEATKTKTPAAEKTAPAEKAPAKTDETASANPTKETTSTTPTETSSASMQTGMERAVEAVTIKGDPGSPDTSGDHVEH